MGSVALAAIGEMLDEAERALEVAKSAPGRLERVAEEARVQVLREARNRVMAAEARFSDVQQLPLPAEAL